MTQIKEVLPGETPDAEQPGPASRWRMVEVTPLTGQQCVERGYEERNESTQFCADGTPQLREVNACFVSIMMTKMNRGITRVVLSCYSVIYNICRITRGEGALSYGT